MDAPAGHDQEPPRLRQRGLGNLKVVFLLFGTFFVTAAFAQTTRIWTGGNGTGIEIGAATNWDTGLPSTATGDTGQFNGTVPGPLSLVYHASTFQSGFGGSGVSFHLTSNQTHSVTISRTPGASGGPIAIYNITVDPGAGAFTFGGANIASRISWIGRPAGAVHALINNSTNAAALTPWIDFAAGGGAVYTLAFGGTGNWQCNNYLNNNASGNSLLQFDGPGTVFWNPTGFLGNSGFNSPIVIDGGRLVLQNTHPRLSNQAITLNGKFEFNLTNIAAMQTLAGIISGAGELEINNGTLILTGTSSYAGSTTVNVGKLVFGGAKTGNGNIALADGATLGVTTTGSQITPAALALGTSSGGTLEFNNVTNTTSAPLSPTALSSAGITTIRINSGNFTVGQSYPLLTWMSGPPPAVSLSAASGFSGNLSFSGNTLLLNVTALNAPTLNFNRAGNNLQLSWNNGFGRFKLQAQTNNLSLGLGSSWSEYPGGHSSPATVPIDDTKGTVFFRLSSSP